MQSPHGTNWYGQKAYVLESDALQTTMVPSLGGKIVSLLDKHSGREWLVGPTRTPRPVDYGAVFIDQDMAGWDEMFPTIDVCDYPAPGAYQERRLPDHGEAWTLDWQVVDAGPGKLSLCVEGVALPYRLERQATIIEPHTLQLDYRLTNTGEQPYYYLWAAHPLFAADDRTRLNLPPSVQEVLSVKDSTVWGRPETPYPWPEATALDGQVYWLDRAGEASRRDCRKYYLPPDQPVSWVKLVDERQKCALKLEWSLEELPYLGVWVDEGTYHRAPCLAPEPSSAYYDRLDLACEKGTAPRIGPGEQRQWRLALQFETMK